MKNITRWSLALIMFSLFLVSYLVTSVSAQNTDCMQHPAGSTARDNCQENNNAAPGSAAAGHMNSGGNDCSDHPAGSVARTSCENP